MQMQGTIKWFNPTKGYGFITRDDAQKDVFLHTSEVEKAGITVREGDKVKFDVEDKPKGLSAINVELV
jgi:CspA family cold shock protein